MKNENQDQKKNRLGLYFLVFGVLFLGFFLHLKQKEKDFQVSKKNNNKTHDNRVNYHLRELQRKQNLNRLKVKVENAEQSSVEVSKNRGYLKKDIVSEEGVRFEVEGAGRQDLLETIRPDMGDEYGGENQEILSEIRQRLQDIYEKRDYDQAYKKAYVREFIENARRDGFEVIMNDDLEVVGVKKVRRPTGFRYPNSVKGKY